MKNFKYLWILAIGAFLFSSCEPEVEDTITPTAGSADFSNYVSIGNSLTAGYADGGLYAESQELSYPNMIASSIAKAGGSTNFVQPTITGNGSGYITLAGISPAGLPILGSAAADPTWTNNVSDLGPFNNLGVPGIRMLDVTVDGYGLANPYYGRMISSGSTTNYLTTAASTNASFFTMWLGNNDVLGYSTSGGAAGVNGAPGTFLGGITPPALFEASFQGMLSAMTANGAKGIVANIPSVTDIPYFTTASYNDMALTADLAAQLNAGLTGALKASIIPAIITEGAKVGLVIPQVVQFGVVTQQVIPGVITEGVKRTQVIPTVITEGVRLNEVIPAVITEGVKIGQVIPQVVIAVVFEGVKQQALAAGADEATAEATATAYVASAEGQAQIAGLEAAYMTAYDVNSDNPQVTDSGATGIEQSTFDAITGAVTLTLQDATVQAEINAFIAAYSAAYLANPTSPTASAPFTQEQFDAVTAATNAAMSTNEVLTIIAAFNQAYLAAYIANPASPQATSPFTQDQFDLVTATVNDQMANNPEVAAGIQAFIAAYVPAYIANPAAPAAVAPFDQAQFDAITAGVNDTLADPAVQGQIQAFEDAYLAAYALNSDAPVATAPFTQEQFDAITANVADALQSAEVQAQINQTVALYNAAYDANPSSPQAPDPALQPTFDQVTAVISGYPNDFVAGPNPFLIQVPTSEVPWGFRKMRSTELVLLPILSADVPGFLSNPTAPGVPTEYILTDDELANIASAVSAYNNSIATIVANTPGVELFDANSLFSEIVSQGSYTAPNGTKYDYNAGFVLGGIFSMDGVHATPKGYAIVANEMITIMNEKFGATIPRVDIEEFRGVKVSGN